MTSLTKVEGTSIIKTDEIGRRKTSGARREQLLDEFERSGLSGAKFAALTGIKYSTFAAWAHRRRKQAGTNVKLAAKPAEPVRWLEALVEPRPSAVAEGVVLRLPGGVRLELTQASQAGLIVSLIRALEQPC
jgi:hypothetical protein